MGRFVRRSQIPRRLPVLQDDREKRPFTLPEEGFHTTICRLVTGDYSFAGLRRIVAIERKSGLGEIIADLSGNNRPRFVRFLERLSRYPAKVMLIEGNGPNDVYSLPDYRGGTTPLARTAEYWLSQITVKYGIPTLFIGDPPLGSIVEQIFQDAYAAGLRHRGGL